MADAILLRRRKLAHRFPSLRQIENRMVGEAFTAAGRARDAAFECARHDGVQATRRRLGQRDGAPVARDTLLIRYPGETLLQQPEPLLVQRVHSSPPRGVHAWRAAQRVDLEAGVVGERKQAGRLSIGERLQDGVLVEGVAGLFHLDGYAEIGGGQKLREAPPRARPKTPRLWAAGAGGDP